MNRYKFFQKIDWLLVLLGGNHKREPKFYLFTVPFPTTQASLTYICDKLWAEGWGFNLLSTTFRGEIYTLRKLAGDNQHQYHLRLYHKKTDGIDFEGHYETDPMFFPAEHKDGVDLRLLTSDEKRDLRRLL